MVVHCAIYFRRTRSLVNSLWEILFPVGSFGVFILVFLLKNTCWFGCSWLYCIAFGHTCGMFPSLTNPHGIAAAGPDRLNGWQGSTKCQASVFVIKSQPPLGLRQRGLTTLLFVSSGEILKNLWRVFYGNYFPIIYWFVEEISKFAIFYALFIYLILFIFWIL